jgi:hypothetical protein
VVGELLQLTPGNEAIYQGDSVHARRVKFDAFRGRLEFPEEGRPPEGLLLKIEGETETFEVRMPTRASLILVPNGIAGPTLTYRRAR